MEPGGSLAHLQKPATCPYLEPHRSILCPHIPLLKTLLNIILTSTSGPSKWSISLRFPHQNPVQISALHPYVLHAPPILFHSIWSPEIHSDFKIVKLYVHPDTWKRYLNYRQGNKSEPKNILLAPKPREGFKNSSLVTKGFGPTNPILPPSLKWTCKFPTHHPCHTHSFFL
jgi:hypothetical protein